MLNPDERAYLRKAFRLRTLDEADTRSVISGEMLNADICADVLDTIMPLIGASDRTIAASLLTKRLSFLLTGNVLYGMSVFDKGLHLSLDASRLEYAHDNGLWTSSLPAALTVTGYAPGARDAWREKVVGGLFRDFIAPIWQHLSAVSGLPAQILWENCAVRVYSLYEGRMEGLNEAQASRQQADFAWLIAEADPALFGLNWNPLKRFRRPAQRNGAGEAVRFRRTCCFYYKASTPVEYCLNCPLCRVK